MATKRQPDVNVPLDEWTETVIDRALAKHIAACPMPERVRKLEIRFAALLGWMTGAGVVGGAAGAMIAKALLGV